MANKNEIKDEVLLGNAGAVAATTGFPNLPSAAGAPGTPTLVTTGFAPVVVDTVAGSLKAYYGGAWHALGGGGGVSSPLTTKGDLWNFTTVDARLPVGATTGHVLQVDPTAAAGIKWGTVSAAATTLNFNVMFGDGRDGAVTLDGAVTPSWATRAGSVYTLTDAPMCTNLIINAGVTVLCASGVGGGYPIFCTGTLTNNGTIKADGNVGSGTTGATAISQAGWFAASSTGVGGGGASAGIGSAGSNAATNAQGSAGGAGGAGVSAGGAGGAITRFATGDGLKSFDIWPLGWYCRLMFSALTVSFQTSAGGGGGGGGGGASVGGGGGGGAGLLAIAAYNIAGSGTISAVGGAGQPGVTAGAAAGGGGGGGGGVIRVLTSTTNYASLNTVTVAGGAGGAGAGGGATGTAGTVGRIVSIYV